MALQVGQVVEYMGKETQVEEIYPNNTAKITNPEWSWDDEYICLENGVDYDVPYWIVVKLSDLSAKV